MVYKRCCTLFLLALFAFPAVAQTQEEPPSEYRYYFKERVPLKLDSDRVAIFRTQATGARISPPDLSAHGIDDISEEDATLPGWYLPRIATRSAPAPMRDRVLDLAFDPAIEFASPVFIGDDGGTVVPTPVILVEFSNELTESDCKNIITQLRVGEIVEANYAGTPNLYKINSNERSGFNVLDTANALAQHPDVLYAEPDMQFTGIADLTPTDPDFSSSWGLHNDGTGGGSIDMDMNGPEAWDISTGDASVLVAVIDTGVDTTHPDLNQVTGTDVTSDAGGGGPVNVCDRHGTAVAGCISQIMNNGLGTTGIAPSCKSVSIRTFISLLDCSGSWSTNISWTVDALAWAEANGVKVTNNSNYYGFTSATIATIYASTEENGMIHFASAGNDGSAAVAYPSSLADVNSIGALESTGGKAGFSQYGIGLQFCAPGQSILSTDIQGTGGYNTLSGKAGNYQSASGTSFASPYTSGVATLICSVAPLLTPTQIETVMQDTAKDRGTTGYDTTYGWGIPDARAALEASSLDYSGYWVNHNHSGLEIGTEVYPMVETLTDGLIIVPDSEILHVEAGTYTQAISITQAVTIVAENGTVTLE